MTTEVYYDLVEYPDSTAIQAAYYDKLNRHLYVAFPSGVIAGYSGINEYEFEDMLCSRSVGSYYSNYIRGVSHGLSGDVTLLQRPVVEEKVEEIPDPDFTVVVKMNGNMQFKLPAANLNNAIDRVEALITKSFSGEYEVLGATRDKPSN